MNNKEKPRKELLKEIEELKKENDRLGHILKKNNPEHKMAELAFDENELSYRDLFEANPYPMYVFDIETLRFMLVNDAAVDHYGYSREEFLSMTMKDIRPMEDLQYLHDSIAQATKKPGIDEIHARHLKKDGTIIDVEITSHQITFKGRVARLIRAHDITERKRNEKKLVQLQKAVDTSGEAIFITDREGIFRYVNPAFTVLYGYTSEEIVGKETPRIFKSGLMQPQDYEMFWKTLLSGQEVRGELINKKKDGTVLNIEGSASPIMDEMNNIIGFLGIQRDITERKKTEEALKESEIQFRALFDKASDGIIFISPKTEIVEVNEAFAKMHGYTIDEMQNMNLQDLDIYDLSQIAPERMKRIENGEEIRFEVQHYHKDGHIINIEVSPCLIAMKKGNLFVAFHRDITKRKQIEVALMESEKSLKEAQRIAKIGSWQWNVATDTVKWSEELYLINGRDPNLPAPNFAKMSSCYTPESWKRLEAAVSETIQTGKSYNLELEIVLPDGTTKPTYALGEADYDVNGNIERLHGTVQDITERKQALLASEKKYRLITEKISDVVWLMDLNGKSIFVSPSIEKFTGYSVDEYLAQTITDRLSPASGLIALETLKREVISDNHSEDIQTEYKKMMILDYRCKDGGIKTGEVLITPNFDENNTLIGIHGVTRDITERTKAVQALKESEKKYRLLLDNATESIAVIQDDMLKYANPKATELFGYSNEELLSIPFPELIYPDDKEMVVDNYQRRLKGETIPNYYHFRILRNDNTLRWVEISAVLLEWQGNVASLNFLTDITIRKQAQQTLQDKVNELELFNSLMVDREIKMVELKKEINELLKKEGKDEKYDIFE